MVKVPIGRFCTNDHMFLWIRERQEKERAVKIKKASVAIRNEKKAVRPFLYKVNPNAKALTSGVFF